MTKMMRKNVLVKRKKRLGSSLKVLSTQQRFQQKNKGYKDFNMHFKFKYIEFNGLSIDPFRLG